MIAIKNKHQYHDVELNFTASGSSRLVIATHDQREEVCKNGKVPSFVGFMRSGVGIPYVIETKSGKAFASDITSSVSKALAKRGFVVKTVETSHSETHEQVVGKMLQANEGFPVLLHVNIWHSDCYNIVWYYFHVVLQIYDSEGKLLTQKVVEGKESLGGSFWNPPKHARRVIPKAFQKKMEEIFNDQEVVAILK